jgi:DamX protein
MATSELSNRLECLTSFSSQLVFVCTDKVKQQSQVVESFIGQQTEETNLALITANELTPLVIYREKLFQQLIGNDKDVNCSLPLNQLLAPLNTYEGPVLISIFEADKLPIKLVKEIWELVLQSRFAKNKQHLNVILMGQSQWAEKIKNALGARSKEKPVLLNGHSFSSANVLSVEQTSNQLADTKHSFSDSPKIVNQELTTNRAVYKKWWFISLGSLIFLATFSGLLYSLYSDQIKSVYLGSTMQDEQEIKPISNDSPTLPINTEALAITQEIPKEVFVEELATSTDKVTLQTNAINIGSEVLVTDWQTASEQLETKIKYAVQPKTAIQETSNLPQSTQVVIEKATPIIEPIEQITDTTNINDYPVKDIPIIDSEPLATNTDVSITESNSNQVVDQSLMLTTLNANRFVIQIAAMSNLNLLQEYAADKQLKKHVWLYTTQRYGGDWHVLLFNQDFSNIEQARQGIESLPTNMLDNVPFVKSIRQVQQEIPTNTTLDE